MVSPLHFVDLEPGTDSLSAGLVPVHGKRAPITLAEEAAVRDAALFKRVDYVFFRRFADLRSPQVAAYVVDNSDESLSEEQLSDLHWHVWMQGIAPLLYIAWPTRLDVLACAREPDFWTDKTNTRQYPTPDRLALTVTLNTAGEIADALGREKARAFSSNRLGDGTFWEDPGNILQREAHFSMSLGTPSPWRKNHDHSAPSHVGRNGNSSSALTACFSMSTSC